MPAKQRGAKHCTLRQDLSLASFESHPTPQYDAEKSSRAMQSRGAWRGSFLCLNRRSTPSTPRTSQLSIHRKMSPKYELIYWPTIPGRGEFIRLAFEATHTAYTDTANASKDGINAVLSSIDSTVTVDSDGNPPPFAPPSLRVPGEGKNGKTLVLYQTPNILAYLGDKLGLAGEDEAEKHWVMSHAFTALDLNNEAHDTHHPVAVAKYYKDQKEEALKKATDFRENRLPKFFGFFERVLKGNEGGQGKYLVGGKLSYADTTVWQVLDGLKFAFPKEMEAREGDHPLLFGTFYPSVREHSGLKDYLVSSRRIPYGDGVFRHYPELDRQ
ncbi:hypothetical protein BDV95DRAFT_249900 [Massariosphaeria phaeospora]|uniref:Glutathione S-transferase n=1 Tax=Massariosphaeria phaeospora TaxID=100035 RepID=A0A7C8M057_9PLEO|nr:hypothetical protein BDV95DRAFT_249900 [Massariosphaeria phaeospora]